MVPLEHMTNAPLVEASLEIRFNAEPAVLTRMDEFYNIIRDTYPQVFVPNPSLSVPNALLNWHFKNENQQRFVSFSVNSFSFHVLDYKDYNDFRAASLPLAQEFCKLFKIKALRRIGTRYINSIIVLRSPDGTIPVRNYLNFGFDLPSVVPKDELEDIHVQFASRMDEGRLVTIIHHQRESDNEPETLIFDLDYSLDKNVFSDNLPSHMDDAHSCIEDVFSNFVAAPYMEFMKGETP